MAVPLWLRWILGTTITALLTVVPYVYYRHCYTHAKRLRQVVDGKVYRSGCMTAAGLREAIARHKFRTVINLMEEAPDPDLANHYFGGGTTKESQLCRDQGANFVFLYVDLLQRRLVPEKRPGAIDRFLQIMDDPANYPVLIHCKAGLHRTGVLTAVYRMEYDHWSIDQAMRELRGNGFGRFSTSANDYIQQYILNYQPRFRN